MNYADAAKTCGVDDARFISFVVHASNPAALLIWGCYIVAQEFYCNLGASAAPARLISQRRPYRVKQ